MNQNLKEILQIFAIIVILSLGLTIFMFIFWEVINYQTYQNYQSQGYKVSFDYNNGCQMALKSTNGSTEWDYCMNLGDQFTLNNYAIRSKQ